MYAQQLFGIAGEQHLQHSGIIAQNLSPGYFPVAGHSGYVWHFRSFQFLLGFADHGHFGNSVDSGGKIFRHPIRIPDESMACGKTALLARGSCQAGESNDVSRGVNAGNLSLKKGVHLNSSKVIRLDPHLFELKITGSAYTTSGIQDYVARYRFTRREMHAASLCCAFVGLYLFYRFTLEKCYVPFLHLPHQFSDYFAVEKFKRTFIPVNYSNFDIESGEYGSVLHSNDTCTDDSNRARYLGKKRHIVAGDKNVPVQIRPGIQCRLATAGNQYLVARNYV